MYKHVQIVSKFELQKLSEITKTVRHRSTKDISADVNNWGSDIIYFKDFLPLQESSTIGFVLFTIHLLLVQLL